MRVVIGIERIREDISMMKQKKKKTLSFRFSILFVEKM